MLAAAADYTSPAATLNPTWTGGVGGSSAWSVTCPDGHYILDYEVKIAGRWHDIISLTCSDSTILTAGASEWHMNAANLHALVYRHVCSVDGNTTAQLQLLRPVGQDRCRLPDKRVKDMPAASKVARAACSVVN